MLKAAEGRVKGFRRCEARIAFNTSAPKEGRVVVYADGVVERRWGEE